MGGGGDKGGGCTLYYIQNEYTDRNIAHISTYTRAFTHTHTHKRAHTHTHANTHKHTEKRKHRTSSSKSKFKAGNKVRTQKGILLPMWYSFFVCTPRMPVHTHTHTHTHTNTHPPPDVDGFFVCAPLCLWVWVCIHESLAHTTQILSGQICKKNLETFHFKCQGHSQKRRIEKKKNLVLGASWSP